MAVTPVGPSTVAGLDRPGLLPPSDPPLFEPHVHTVPSLFKAATKVLFALTAYDVSGPVKVYAALFTSLDVQPVSNAMAFSVYWPAMTVPPLVITGSLAVGVAPLVV